MKKCLLSLAFLALTVPSFAQFEAAGTSGLDAYAKEAGLNTHWSLSVAPAQFINWDWLSGIYVGVDYGFASVTNAGGTSNSTSIALKPALGFLKADSLVLKGGCFLGYVYGQSSNATGAIVSKPSVYFEPFVQAQWWLLPPFALGGSAGYKIQAGGLERSLTFSLEATYGFPDHPMSTKAPEAKPEPAPTAAAPATPVKTPEEIAAEQKAAAEKLAAEKAAEKKRKQQAAAAAAAAAGKKN